MDRSRRAELLRTLLSSTLVAAFLNLATSFLASPRAFGNALHLGLPLLAGFLVLALAATAWIVPAALAGERLGLAPAPLRGALGVSFVLASVLAPMVEVALREASSERAAVVIGCAAGFVVCAGLFLYAWGARASCACVASLAASAPLAALVILLASWALAYHASDTWSRGFAGVVGLGALVAVVRAAPRLDRPRTLPALCGLVVLLGVLDGGLGALHASRPKGAVSSARPPVVLLTVDTLRADRVLGVGPHRVPTPAIDALADDSVVFTQARAAAPWTKPSLATLLTGLSPLVHGMTNRRARMPESIETLAEHMHAAGYHTAGMGLNVHLERAFRFDQGFDDYAFPARSEYGIALGSHVLEHLAPAHFPEIYPSTTAIADVAVDWIDAHADEPFFLWVHVLDPHWPYEPPPEWVERPEREPRRWGDPTMVTNVQAGNTKPGEAERERVQELYAGEIRYVDSQLARILDELRAKGLYDQALIVFASDHGEEFWEHGRYEHGHTLYDEVLHVPLLFKLPGEGTRERIDAAVTTQALTPTVLDFLGLPYEPKLLSSRSLADWWRNPAQAVAEPLFSGGTYYFGEKHGVVWNGIKLVHELDTQRLELFDLAADPAERHSLTAARPELRDEGLRLLEGWEEDCARLRAALDIRVDAGVEAGANVLERLRGLGYAGGTQ